MCADCRQRHLVEARDFALMLRVLGEKLESGIECDDLTYIETMEAAETVIASLFPILLGGGPAFAQRAKLERRRITMSN